MCFYKSSFVSHSHYLYLYLNRAINRGDAQGQLRYCNVCKTRNLTETYLCSSCDHDECVNCFPNASGNALGANSLTANDPGAASPDVRDTMASILLMVDLGRREAAKFKLKCFEFKARIG